MFKTRKVDEYGGQSGNEEKSEDVTVTEEKIIGDDGIERTIIKKTTTRKTIQSQQVTQGARVTTVKRTIYSKDGKEITEEEFEKLDVNRERPKSIKSRHTRQSSSSSDDETFTEKIKSFFGKTKKPEPQSINSNAASGVSDKGESVKSTNKSSPAIQSSPSVQSSATGQPSSEPSVQSSATGQPSSEPTVDDNTFAKQCLDWHNYYRALHGVPPLKLSDQLNKFAKEWAKNLASKNMLQHRQNNDYGENLYMMGSSNPNVKISGKEPVEDWYNEIKKYQFGVDSPKSSGTGHFTQVIWRDSKELGCAQVNNNGQIYVVANYNPAGNFMGKFKENVPKLI